MRVAIVGSRHFGAPNRVIEYVKGMAKGSSIVTGSASGVDAVVTRAAREAGVPVNVLHASFEELADTSKAAERNRRLVDGCDVLVAFWDGRSSGTRATIDRALDAGREVHVFMERA